MGYKYEIEAKVAFKASMRLTIIAVVLFQL